MSRTINDTAYNLRADILTTENGINIEEGSIHVYNDELKAHLGGQVVTVYPQAGGGSDYTETIVNISSAQILAMGTSPIELLPAAGVGNYYDIDKIVIEYNHNTTAYTSPDLAINSGGSLWGFVYSQFVLLAGAEDSVTKVVSPMDYNATDFITASYNQTLNKGFEITTYDASNPTLGDGTLRVKIYHKTVTFGA